MASVVDSRKLTDPEIVVDPPPFIPPGQRKPKKGAKVTRKDGKKERRKEEERAEEEGCEKEPPLGEPLSPVATF